MQLENERLLSENIDLRTTAINLEEQLETVQNENEENKTKLAALLNRFHEETDNFLSKLSLCQQEIQGTCLNSYRF